MPNFLEYEHLVIMVLVLLVALLVVSSGKGLGTIVSAILRKWFGKPEVTINLGEVDMATKKKPTDLCAGCMIPQMDPSHCAPHQAEHERSVRNETQITALWENYNELRKDMTHGFLEVNVNISETQKVILQALAGGRNGFKGGGKGGRD